MADLSLNSLARLVASGDDDKFTQAEAAEFSSGSTTGRFSG
ncbi:hypothetical protein MARINON1_60437 [Marinobacter salarius]|nr:hypothetical protein MBHK15_100054 [Marinobacter salarius]VXC51711.1 hypothetical protein MARINON1_60437 [Marinobacter salarius]